MNVLKSVGVFVGWLSGSLAGVTAFFYAFGYVITLANLRLLGLDVYLFRYDPSFYLSRGGSFFLYLASYAVIISLVLLPVAAVFLVAQSWIARRVRPDGPEPARGGLAAFAKHHGGKCRGVGFVAILILLGFLLWLNFTALTNLVSVTNLLYEPMGRNADVVKLFATGATNELDQEFLNAVYGLFGAGTLLYFAWRLTAPYRLRHLMLVPFLSVFILYGLLLPLVYGAVKVSGEFARIDITRVHEGGTGLPQDLFLLNKTDDEFLLWDPVDRTVVWLPVSDVTGARIGLQAPIMDIKALGGGQEP